MEQSGNENLNNLNEFIQDVETPLSLQDYRRIAQLFQVLTENEIRKILRIHNDSINMVLNDIEICYPNSALNTSTAFGFIIEAFITRQLPTSIFTSTLLSTIKSAYDFKYIDDEKIEIFVNLKVEKNTSKNNGIVAGTILRNFYTSNNKPKLYLILKLAYRIDEDQSILLIENVESLYLESFLTLNGCLKSDSRNWTNTFNILSGRLQIPSKSRLNSNSCGINTIPEPVVSYNFIDELAINLKNSRNK